jgi:serine protease Do
MGEIHSREALYTVRSGGEDTKVPIFLTSAPVYRGNDGGAAVTMEGRLAGMASSELTQRLGVSPYTAVIPGSELPRVVERILSRDEASAVKLGVQGDLVEVPSLKQPGFYVLEVEEGSTAQRGGIQPTDILLTIDGQPVTRERAIDSYLKGKKAGDSLQVTLSRLNEILSLTMKIY